MLREAIFLRFLFGCQLVLGWFRFWLRDGLCLGQHQLGQLPDPSSTRSTTDARLGCHNRRVALDRRNLPFWGPLPGWTGRIELIHHVLYVRHRAGLLQHDTFSSETDSSTE